MIANPQGSENNLERISVRRIQPSRGWRAVDLQEFWQHRNLLFHLVWRDIRVLFSNTGLGVLWIVIQPLATAIVITIVLGYFARIPTNNIPYPLVVLSGLVLYNYFSVVVIQMANSMVNSAYLLSKVYFPRLIIPTVPILTGLIDIMVLLFVLLVVAYLYNIQPTAAWLFLPIPILINIILTLGVGLWVSALNVFYRDVGKAIPIILQIGIYACPIFYFSNLVPEPWRGVYSLNPIVGVVDSLRWSLLGVGPFPSFPLAVSIVAALLLFVSGIYFFRRMEEKAADVI